MKTRLLTCDMASKTMTDMASVTHNADLSTQCMASLFEAMSGVKLLKGFKHVVTYELRQTSFLIMPSTLLWTWL